MKFHGRHPIQTPVLVAMTLLCVAAVAQERTPVGAEKGGNKDGTVPAFAGMDTPLPGWSKQ